MLEHITKENFKDFYTNNKLCIVDFWATWCSPCRMLTPNLEKLNNDGYSIGKVNVDEEEELSMLFNVEAIPTILLFKDGKLVDKMVGYKSYDDLKAWVLKNE